MNSPKRSDDRFWISPSKFDELKYYEANYVYIHYMEEKYAKLVEFVKHDNDCNFYSDSELCSCGLNDILG